MSANSHYARVSGIGPVTLATPLTALFAKIVKQPLPAFLDSIAAIEEAGCIPGVMGAARCTLDAAKDAKTFGNLKGDVLSVDEVGAYQCPSPVLAFSALPQPPGCCRQVPLTAPCCRVSQRT